MEEIKQKLIDKVKERLEKEEIPNSHTLEIIDRLIQLNAISQK